MGWFNAVPGIVEWAEARQVADELMAAHPNCKVKPVIRRLGIGLELACDTRPGGVCAAVGSVDEVRAVLEGTSA